MSISENEILKVAHLARLAIPAEELQAHTKNISNILDLVAEMDNANTDEIVPMSHPLHLKQPLRADEVTETNQRDTMQAIAPKVESGLYLVPQVIE